MGGILLTVTIFALIAAVGCLFAWMVSLNGNSSHKHQEQLQTVRIKARRRY